MTRVKQVLFIIGFPLRCIMFAILWVLVSLTERDVDASDLVEVFGFKKKSEKGAR